MDTAALTRPLGPLPVWGWGAIAGGALLLIMARHGNPVAQAAISPSTPFPAAPGDANVTNGATGQTGAMQTPITVPAGSTVYDPNTGQSTAPVTIADLLGGQSVTDVIKKLGPDYTQFSFTDNGLGLGVSHAAQNVLDAQANIANTQAYYDYTNKSLDTLYGYDAHALDAANAANAIAYNYDATINKQYYDYTLGALQSNNQTGAAETSAYYDYLSKLSAPRNDGGVTTTPSAPYASVPGSAVPQPSVKTCNNGNFSCIRSQCAPGNNACAMAVAPWFNPATMRF